MTSSMWFLNLLWVNGPFRIKSTASNMPWTCVMMMPDRQAPNGIFSGGSGIAGSLLVIILVTVFGLSFFVVMVLFVVLIGRSIPFSSATWVCRFV